MVESLTRWLNVSRRNARSVQTTVGWIFWDPGAVERYTALGLPGNLAGPLGYIAARAAPLSGAGAEAVVAAFGSISPVGIRATFEMLGGGAGFQAMWDARDEAVVEGIGRHAPDIVDPLVEFGPELWAVVERLPLLGRVFYGAHLSMPRPPDPLLSGWHAVNCLREWRGDTHWALAVAAGLNHTEVSILHNAWLDYEGDWLALSRGSSLEDIDAGWASLTARGFAHERAVTQTGLELRQHIEDDTDRLTSLPWELLGEVRSVEFAERFEPPCRLLLKRVDQTAGPNYQPASRERPPRLP